MRGTQSAKRSETKAIPSTSTMEVKKQLLSPTPIRKSPLTYYFENDVYPPLYSISPEKKKSPFQTNPSCWNYIPSDYNKKSERFVMQGINNLLVDKKVEQKCERFDEDITGRVYPTNSEGHTLIQEEERCYLCMRYILPNAEAFVGLPCYDSCRSKFHFLCLANALWHFRKAEVVCPICTDPRNVLSERNSMEQENPHEEICSFPPGLFSISPKNDENRELFREFVRNPEKVRKSFIIKLFPVMEKILGNRSNKCESLMKCTDNEVRYVQNMITEGASSIYGMSYASLGESSLPGSPRHITKGEQGDDFHEVKRDNKLGNQLMRRLVFGRLLSYGVSVMEIYLFLANSFRGLLFINFSLRDVKKLEETGQVKMLVDLYKIGCDDLRAVLGGQLNIQNLLSFGWKAQTFQTLGIDMHQLCILKLQKDNIPSFGFTMDEWLNEMKMTKTVVKLLRIHANDFEKPEGKLANAGWDLARIIYHLKITVEEAIEFRLNGYSSCLGKKGMNGQPVPKSYVDVAKQKPSHYRKSQDTSIGRCEKDKDFPLWRKKPGKRGGVNHERKVSHYNIKHSRQHRTASGRDTARFYGK